MTATGRAELASDQRFASMAARAVHVAAWLEVRGTPLRQKTSAEWLGLFRAADIAAMPIQSIETLRHDPHLTAVNLITQEDHPTEGKAAVLRSSVLADGHRLPHRPPSAPKGWDTVAILTQLGYSSAEVQSLFEQGAAQSA
ncbi:MAG: CoA transferase [Rhodobacteraceae bacterium]|nr:CoA transferase [Paracoccaceae bacterium]